MQLLLTFFAAFKTSEYEEYSIIGKTGKTKSG
jgi:hypothetical protein